MTTLPAGGRDRNASAARLIFDLPPARTNEPRPVLDRCAQLMREVQT